MSGLNIFNWMLWLQHVYWMLRLVQRTVDALHIGTHLHDQLALRLAGGAKTIQSAPCCMHRFLPGASSFWQRPGHYGRF